MVEENLRVRANKIKRKKENKNTGSGGRPGAEVMRNMTGYRKHGNEERLNTRLRR
jgi:hypothetical protein